MDPKDQIITSLQKAQFELENALVNLAHSQPSTRAACGLPPTRLAII